MKRKYAILIGWICFWLMFGLFVYNHNGPFYEVFNLITNPIQSILLSASGGLLFGYTSGTVTGGLLNYRFAPLDFLRHDFAKQGVDMDAPEDDGVDIGNGIRMKSVSAFDRGARF